MDTFEKISSIIRNTFDLGENEITVETTFEDVGADSIDLVDLVLEIEEEFSVSVSDDEFENIKNVGDLVEIIDALLV